MLSTFPGAAAVPEQLPNEHTISHESKGGNLEAGGEYIVSLIFSHRNVKTRTCMPPGTSLPMASRTLSSCRLRAALAVARSAAKQGQQPAAEAENSWPVNTIATMTEH